MLGKIVKYFDYICLLLSILAVSLNLYVANYNNAITWLTCMCLIVRIITISKYD
jgi:hypothetical protein